MSTIAIGERFTLTLAAGRKTLEPLSGWKPICAALLLSASMTIVSSAQTFTKLADFNGSDGIDPYALVQGKDGNLYGTAAVGGANDKGTVFKMTPDGTVTAIYSFCSKTSCTDGAQPEAGLVLGTDGNFYGTTWGGGENYYGLCTNGCGTVFKLTLSGTLTTLYTFCSESNCYDGENPDAGLVQGTDGNFYGTTERGGPNGRESIFKITPSALLTTLSSFCPKSGCSAANGENPMAGLALGSDGNFYGTAEGGGTGNQGIVFRMTPSGTLTTLHSFCSQSGCSDGADPQSTLVQGTDGNFYGTTDDGGTGTSGEGTIFKITPSGAFTSLHSFDGTDGSQPEAVLMQSTNGVFYSTATEGGAGGDGTVFSLSMGLHPFVQALTYRGKVGNTIEFLGQGFTSSTAVSFNGTKSANVKVVSGTYLTATVPSGATTGFVTATASGGTLKSNQTFLVTPQITSFSPESGSAETVVTINGESFKGATSVVFGRVKATSFKVDSYTEITATVPSGAKTGKITVITPGGTATSAGTFTVP